MTNSITREMTFLVELEILQTIIRLCLPKEPHTELQYTPSPIKINTKKVLQLQKSTRGLRSQDDRKNFSFWNENITSL